MTHIYIHTRQRDKGISLITRNNIKGHIYKDTQLLKLIKQKKKESDTYTRYTHKIGIIHNMRIYNNQKRKWEYGTNKIQKT